ncbi:ATP-grasp fold amidoligase family protein [Pseudidiomarina sp. YC-516-91]|uniref:ATP-grasp fold amidoligase family protein n=1 Tax=Pseudidiomarina salilacus TaxID=3384452 RepID=UPI003984A871
MANMRNMLVKLKNENFAIRVVWHLYLLIRGWFSLKFLSDEEKIISLYKSYSGRIPNLDAPLLFSEKLQAIKLDKEKSSLMKEFACKYKCREALSKKGLENILIKLLYVTDKPLDVRNLELPKRYVIKASHGSGWNIIKSNENRKLNWFWVKVLTWVWLKSNIFWLGRESSYKDLKPFIIIEEYLENTRGNLLDYKLHFFNGKFEFVQINSDRNGKAPVQNFYDIDFKLLPFYKDIESNPDVLIEKPALFNEMIEIASNLSKPFDYVRVDFYEVSGKLYFGEMTFFPHSGLPDFRPVEYDEFYGNRLSIT